MKKFIVAVLLIVIAVFGFDALYYRYGWYIDFSKNSPVETFVKTDENSIYLNRNGSFSRFEIRGVDMGTGIPGEWANDFAVSKETYLRWFRQIKELGANTVRLYTINDDTFYEAFYEYNKENPDPLYLLQGVWLNDYIQFSRHNAYDKEFYDEFLLNCRTMVDVIHGNKKISLGRMASAGSGTYDDDISEWVLGYILGVEWEKTVVEFTNQKFKNQEKYLNYKGKYLYASPEAEPFENMLAMVGDKVIEYESERYGSQRIIAFSNWPTTDPFDYSESVSDFFQLCGNVDVEHIKCTEKFIAGQFASYHVYPYYPDFLHFDKNWEKIGDIDKNDFKTDNGKLNTYKAYLTLLVQHHNMPVVISEFGVSSGRGRAQTDYNTGRNQGKMSEKEQGEAIVECYRDIMDSGCAGSCVFSWQDEWFKRTWNTMHAVNMKRNPYWSDYQTNEQYFGLLSFDPGKKKSVCYVDGDVSEWTDEDVVSQSEDGALSLSMKYDEKFMYWMVHKENYEFGKEKIYIPLDITHKSGSSYCANNGLRFDRAADFLITIDGRSNSRIQVQERYEALRSTFSEETYGYNTYVRGNVPDKDSPEFRNIDMVLKRETYYGFINNITDSWVYETGLLTYGNANPEASDFNSLADFIVNGDYIEIKLPWQLMNFADPSRMTVHDDYYDDNYGVEYIDIDEMYMGVAAGNDTEGRIKMKPAALEGWGNEVTYHERLKSSYYMLQKEWSGSDES